MLDLVGDGLTDMSVTGSLGSEKLLDGNKGDQKNINLLLFSLSIYV